MPPKLIEQSASGKVGGLIDEGLIDDTGDLSLVQRMGTGDETAFRVLVDRHLGSVLSNDSVERNWYRFQ